MKLIDMTYKDKMYEAAIKEAEKRGYEKGKEDERKQYTCDNCGGSLGSGIPCGACYQKHGTKSFEWGVNEAEKRVAKEIFKELDVPIYGGFEDYCAVMGMRIEEMKKKYLKV